MERHALTDEFPEYAEKIQELKQNDPDFAQLAREYHKLNHEIEGLESRNMPISDTDFEQLKLRRHQLKDQVYKGWLNGQS